MAANDRPADIQWLVDNQTEQISGYVAKGREMGPPAMLSTDSNGNTVLVGAGGVILPTLGSDIITIGAGGVTSNLTDALALRAAQSHTLLTTFTGSITGTVGGSVDKRQITPDSGDPLAAFVNLKSIGVRIGGSGPIVRAFITKIGIATSKVQLRYPCPQDYSAAQIDVYLIKQGAIALLPGTLLEEPLENLKIPAFTTLTALVPHTAGIVKTGGQGLLFSDFADQNEVRITNLYLADTYSAPAGGSQFWQIPNANNHANQIMCDFEFFNNRCDTAAQDMVYVGNGALLETSNGGGLVMKNNYVRGRFDALYLGGMRVLDVSENHFHLISMGLDIDGGKPTAIGYGFSALTDWAYCSQRHTIQNNFINCRSLASGDAGETTEAYGVELRVGIPPSKMQLMVRGNTIKTELVIGLGYTAGVAITGTSGTSTPDINVIGNSIDSRVTTVGAVAEMISNTSTTAIIKRSGNTVPAGGSTTQSANSAAATTY